MPRRLGRKDLTVKPASKQQNASKRRRIEDDQDNTAKERQKSSASHSTGGAAASRPKTPRLVSDRVLRSTPPGRRDPFDKLGDTEVGLITSFLSARDTEILRRVSKQWKGYSEYFHSTEAAVLRHFPWAAARAKKCGSREEFNLLFRRCGT